MKLRRILSSGQLRQLWNRNPFRNALVLSVALHGFIFLQLGLLLRMIQPPASHTPPPLVYDFVFSPEQPRANEAWQGETPLADVVEDKISPVEKLEPLNQVMDIEKMAEIRMPEDASIPDPPSPEPPDFSNATPARLPEELASSPIEAIEPVDFAISTDRPVEKSPVHARIGLSEKEMKMIRKKASKWEEDFYKMEMPDSTITWEHKGNLYRAIFRHKAAKNETDLDELSVTIEAEKNGLDVATELHMRRLAFSNFAQFVDYWDPRVALHDDKLEGRFHSNSEIRVYTSGKAKPEFQGRVTTASFDVKPVGFIPYLDRETMFPEGLETGVKAIKLPKAFFLFETDSTIMSDDFLQFNEDAYITFKDNGTIEWDIRDTDKKGVQRVGENAFYLLGHKKKKLFVKGTVKGKILIYSPGTIEIRDDLTYANNPEDGPSTDFLGIVSGKNVEIASPDDTGRGDLLIYASIYARRAFKVKDFGSGKNEDLLYIYGSLTAGTVLATEPRYATDIRFDQRLERRRAPNFPMSNRYELVEWDERWEVKPEREQSGIKN